jgi:hypothetical protein
MLDGTARQVDVQWANFHGGPAAGSPADVEIATKAALRSSWSDRPLYDANGVAAAILLSAVDHIRALHRAFDVPPLAWASESLARACAELAARAWWLVDPDICASDRVARYATEQLFSLRQGQRAQQQLKSGRDPAELASEIEAWANQHNLLVLHESGAPIAIGARRLPTTSLLERMLPGLGAQLYQAVSPVAHGTIGGVLGFVRSSASALDDEIGAVEVRVSDVLRIASCAFVAFLPATARLVGHFGWDARSWSSWEADVRRRFGELRRLYPDIAQEGSVGGSPD